MVGAVSQGVDAVLVNEWIKRREVGVSDSLVRTCFKIHFDTVGPSAAKRRSDATHKAGRQGDDGVWFENETAKYAHGGAG